MTAIPGTIIAALISPGDTAATFPTHDSEYGKGGLHTAATTTERDAIPAARKTTGMLCYVIADNTTYQWDGATWIIYLVGGRASSTPVVLPNEAEESEQIFIPGPAGKDGGAGLVGPPGMEGESDDPLFIPGPKGDSVTGPAGIDGQPGPAVFLALDADEQDVLPIPGPKGDAGGAGGSGAAGRDGPAIYLAQDIEVEEPPMIPGPKGDTGGAGGTGSAGRDGPAIFLAQDVEVEEPPMVPGPKGDAGGSGNTGSTGPIGPAVFMVMENDAEDPPMIPGPTGPQGSTGAAGSNASGGGSTVVLFQEGDGDEANPIPPIPAGMEWALELSPDGIALASTDNCFPTVYDGGSATGTRYEPMVGIAASIAADTKVECYWDLPLVFPVGKTPKVRIRGRANAVTGNVKVNPKWACLTDGDEPSTFTLNAEGTNTIAITVANAYKSALIPLVATGIVPGKRLIMSVVFETSGFTLAVTSGWRITLVFA